MGKEAEAQRDRFFDDGHKRTEAPWPQNGAGAGGLLSL